MGRLARASVACFVLVGIAFGTAGAGTAVAVPPVGSPTDDFQNRRSIGEEGLMILGNGVTARRWGLTG